MNPDNSSIVVAGAGLAYTAGVLSVNADTYAKYKAIGGAKALKQMIFAATPQEPTP